VKRRDFVKSTVTGLFFGSIVSQLDKISSVFGTHQSQSPPPPTPTPPPGSNGMVGMDMGDTGVPMPGVSGEVNHEANGFNPTDYLTEYDTGKVSQLPNGQTLREFSLVALDKSIEIVPGIMYPAWTYNGKVPGPTLRVTEGDHVRINFSNGSEHMHTIHFHGIHAGNMDGVLEPVEPGATFTYEFDAEPFGVHLYHCHAFPLAEHIAKGLYGAFIIEPKDGWAPVDQELVMVMTGYDTDFDGENDFYTVNGIPFHYSKHPIQLKVNEKVRVFLVNILEFDPLNSFHLHANFFHYYPTGTSKTPSEFTDIVNLIQGQRGILEFSFKFPGKYMFHAHQSELADLGWMGIFQVE
jgi:manganese oxidase